MLKEFKNPSNLYRPIPFWSWNDKLETEEIREQIKELKKGGMGGYFMHARSGLKTPYLSGEWMEAIGTGIASAKEEGMRAWIYDEEGWPSGFAGGLVPAQSEAFWAKFMTAKEYGFGEEIPWSNLIAAYLLRDGENGTLYERIPCDGSFLSSQGDRVYGVMRHVNPYYVDTLCEGAILAFLACTHEKYEERFGEEFGRSMFGFFTDEPRFACNNFGDLAWSDDLPDNFYQEYGYDIREHLPALFLPTAGYEKYRYEFWETVSRMFVTHYMKAIYDWCEEHHCLSTGHIMMEESIFSQMTSTAGVMPFYEYLHVPGIDWLRRMISSPVIGKQVGSAACQLGKKQVLTESYALCGWDVNFEELKWIAEWQFVNGVNQICQHLMAYTLRGVRKRDYPPSHFTQQSWWEKAGLFNDYLSRLCVALSEGDQEADVLLLHPMRSGYLAFDGTRTEEIRELDDAFVKASDCLSGGHISYHYGDETIIGSHGRVENGRFVVGRIGYQTVVLPHMLSIDKKTLRLLCLFGASGGKIISLGSFPRFTNGAKEELMELAGYVSAVSCQELRPLMEKEKRLSLSITCEGEEVDDIHYQQRKAEAGTYFYLVHLSQENRCRAKIRVLGKKGQLLRFHPENGEAERISYTHDNGDTCTELIFEPMQSYLLLCEEGEFSEYQVPEEKTQLLELGDSFEIVEMSHNAVTLDTCTYRIDGGVWQEEIPVIHLQERLLQMQRPCQAELCFSFEAALDPEGNREFYAVIEDAGNYKVKVNQQEIPVNVEGWWKDKSFHKVDIKKYIRPGVNTLELSILFQQPQKVYDVLYGENVYETEKNKITYEVELESIYLVGDFGVVSKNGFEERERKASVTDGPFVIVDAPRRIEGHQFTKSGLLFFAGDLTVRQTMHVTKEEGKRQVLGLHRQRAPLAEVYVNGRHVKDSLWAPYEADITDYVKDGDNIIDIRLYASNRNLLGPHHHIDGECYNVGPDSFTGKWSWVERTSEADATDITDREKNYWTDSYSFVEFGI